MSVNNALGLDIGEKRIGVARVNMLAKLPEPLTILKNDQDFTKQLKNMICEHQIDTLIVGLPRNMSGQETAQTSYVRKFAKDNLEPIGLTIIFQDETLSSVAAESRIDTQKNPKHGVDSMAAAVILEDYIKENEL